MLTLFRNSAKIIKDNPKRYESSQILIPELKICENESLGYTKLITQGDKQYVILTDKYDPNTGRIPRTKIKALSNRFTSPKIRNAKKLESFTNKLSQRNIEESPKLKLDKPVWKKHKIKDSILVMNSLFSELQLN